MARGYEKSEEYQQHPNDFYSQYTMPGAVLDDEALRAREEEESLQAIYGSDQPPEYDDLVHEMKIGRDDFNASATILDDGRVNINIADNDKRFSKLLVEQMRLIDDEKGSHVSDFADHDSLEDIESTWAVPRLNVVIHVVGSRGDVQPFIALGIVLKETYKHRVRLATHAIFQSFVEENGLEFFNIGGDPAALMAFMVKNPGLMPGMDSLKRGDVGRRKREIFEIMKGCWRSCFESGDGVHSEDDIGSDGGSFRPHSRRGFAADIIIANPPSFAHVHCAQKLGIPLHLMFTMPWTPTQVFPHPLANIQPSKVDASLKNLMSYPMVEMMMWQGLGSTINAFRSKILDLETIRIVWGAQAMRRLKIPFTYLWSPALIPKPKDWGSHISVVGFPFLSLASNYVPDFALQQFLDAGPPPIYVGFGSIVVDDPASLLELVYEAIRRSGQRALVSKGWGGLESSSVPGGVFILGNVPHDWLFQHVSCVVHHGGAGTTAAGIRFGKPTVVVPFFGDQFFWGSMIARAGAGPMPIPYRQLNAEKLTSAIRFALAPNVQTLSLKLGQRIAGEDGAKMAAVSFHKQQNVDDLKCSLDPTRVAVWKLRHTRIKLSALSATILIDAGIIKFKDLKLYRPREYDLEGGPTDPITGAAWACIDVFGSMAMGVVDMPIEVARAWRGKPELKPTPKELAAKTHNTTSEPAGIELPGSLPGNQDTETMPLGSRRLEGSATGIAKSGHHEPEMWNQSSSSLHSDQSQISQPTSSGSKDSKHVDSPSRMVRVTHAAAVGSGKGLGRILSSGFKSPFEATLAIAKGFHNVPRLYGDETVRPQERITGAWSGVKAAGKGVGFGLYDGVTGLVMQPMDGAKQEGVSGFFKGVGKGLGGAVMKPIAGGWGIMGYTFDGIDKEIQKLWGSNIEAHIIATRKAQGFEEVQRISAEEKGLLTYRWSSAEVQSLKKKKRDKTESASVDSSSM